jgi:hypothetical protein
MILEKIIPAIGAIALPLAVGIGYAAQHSPPSQSVKGPEFEVASIKPAKSAFQGFQIRMAAGGTFQGTINVKSLIEVAYDVKDSQITGAPSWVDSDR